jgi:phosphohistidine phosphatase
MARLILMRHAKSDWNDASITDHDRPLNARGRRDAPAMARWIIESGFTPELLIHSTARRCVETVELLVQNGLQPDSIVSESQLYLSSPQTLLAAVEAHHSGASSVMLVAHNPGISYLAGMLSGEAIEMPTAAVCVFEAAGDSMNHFAASDPKPLAFMRPKALKPALGENA